MPRGDAFNVRRSNRCWPTPTAAAVPTGVRTLRPPPRAFPLSFSLVAVGSLRSFSFFSPSFRTPLSPYVPSVRLRPRAALFVNSAALLLHHRRTPGAALHGTRPRFVEGLTLHMDDTSLRLARYGARVWVFAFNAVPVHLHASCTRETRRGDRCNQRAPIFIRFSVASDLVARSATKPVGGTAA
jgi:hypothetical protein